MPRKAYAGDEKNIKSVRWEEILRLISEEDIGTQQELQQKLNSRGYNVTQGTVSRDIRELHLIKAARQGGGYHYQASKKETHNPVTSQFYSLYKSVVLHVECALNQVVISCYTGMADAVCASMDGLEWDGVLGTIAGDDTILVITKSEQHAAALTKKLREL